jgi:hypothetical protein
VQELLSFPPPHLLYRQLTTPRPPPAPTHNNIYAHALFSFFCSLFQDGWPIIKHPRKGRPARRHLVCKEGYIGVIEDPKDSRSLHKKGYHISSILGVAQGATTGVFDRTLADAAVRAAKNDFCLSLEFKERTIDIECDTPQAARDLLKCLEKITN